MARVAPVWDLAVIAAAKAALSAAVLAGGFVALSDDDFSRTVIAEQFAHAPSLDPSGTSWLPLPFWIHGAAMLLVGRGVAVAHGAAVLLGVLSVLLVHRAASWLGASRPGALLAALVAGSIPTAARLGVSTQPEALTAGLLMLGAAASGLDGLPRFAGALSLSAACLCRYEAWGAAAVFAAFAFLDGALAWRKNPHFEVLTSGFAPRGSGRLRQVNAAVLGAAGLVAVAAPLAWVGYGALAHGDALFFLHRVAAYRRAVGGAEPLGTSLFAYPFALLVKEPEVSLAVTVALRVGADRAPRALGGLGRPALVVASVLLFLMVGRVLDGAPTHHEARTLLPVWTFFAIIGAEGLARALRPVPGRARGDTVARWAPLALAVAAVSALLRVNAPAEPGTPRAAEQSIGSAAERLVDPTERLLVDTADYGYFAVIAAFGAPERAAPVERHDPRDPPEGDPFASAALLEARLDAERARWLVVRGSHRALAEQLGAARATAGDLTLFRLR